MDECLNGEVFALSRKQESQPNSGALTSRLKDTCHDSFTGLGTAYLSHEPDSNQSNDQLAVKWRYSHNNWTGLSDGLSENINSNYYWELGLEQ